MYLLHLAVRGPFSLALHYIETDTPAEPVEHSKIVCGPSLGMHLSVNVNVLYFHNLVYQALLEQE